MATHLESFVLQDPLDSGIFTIRREFGLEDNPKRTIAHDLALGVLHFLRLPRHPILHLFSNHLCAYW